MGFGYGGKWNCNHGQGLAVIDALAEFIQEIGLPVTLGEMGITDKEILRKTADSSQNDAAQKEQSTKSASNEVITYGVALSMVIWRNLKKKDL